MCRLGCLFGTVSFVGLLLRVGVQYKARAQEKIVKLRNALGCPTNLKEVVSFARKNNDPGVVFTTVTLTANKTVPAHADWVRNWFYQCRRLGIQYPIVFGVDEPEQVPGSCAHLADICCISVPREDFRHADLPRVINHRDKVHLAAVDLKYAYAQELLSRGFRISFSDSWSWWFKRPLSTSHEEDMVWLSDDKTADDRPDIWNRSSWCVHKVYKAPCLSTAIWEAKPVPAVIKFFQGIIADLSGSGAREEILVNQRMAKTRPQATVALYSKATHGNIGVWMQRRLANQSLDLHVLRPGGMSASDKKLEFIKRDLWHPYDGVYTPSVEDTRGLWYPYRHPEAPRGRDASSRASRASRAEGEEAGQRGPLRGREAPHRGHRGRKRRRRGAVDDTLDDPGEDEEMHEGGQKKDAHSGEEEPDPDELTPWGEGGT